MPKASAGAYRLSTTVMLVSPSDARQFRRVAQVINATIPAVRNNLFRLNPRVLPTCPDFPINRPFHFRLMSRLIVEEGKLSAPERRHAGVLLLPHAKEMSDSLTNRLTLEAKLTVFNTGQLSVPRLDLVHYRDPPRSYDGIWARVEQLIEACRRQHPGPYRFEQLILRRGYSNTAIAYHLVQA